MNRWSFFFLPLITFFVGCSNEEVNPIIEKHISLWQKDGIDQSQISYEVVADLVKRNDSAHFAKEVRALYAYLANYPDKKIEAQTLLYHVLGSKLLRLKHQPDVQLLDRALLLAKEIDNEHLVSEIYSMYATVYGDDGTYLYYSLKTLEIQEKYGLENFTYVQNRFFDISRTLLNAKEYQKSIYYGKESLGQIAKTTRIFDTSIYVYLYDILGNDYLQLNQLDSAEKYFSLGIKAASDIFRDSSIKNLWISINTGNLGQIDFLRKNYNDAYVKIQNHFDVATKYQDHLNIAIAGNRLGDFYFFENKYAEADKNYNTALQAALVYGAHNHASYSATLLRDINMLRKNFSKALEYEQLSTKLTNDHQKYLDLINLHRLQAIQQMERSQAAVLQSKTDLQQEKHKLIILSYLYIFIFVIVIIIILRMRMRNQHRMIMSNKEKEALAMEMSFAQTQIQNFKKSIIEKNSLIDELTTRVNKNHKFELNQSLLEQTLITETEWAKFKVEFLKVYPDFQQVIKEYLPQPTSAEQRLLSLIILGLDHQQIGNALGISKENVTRRKRQLRHRLQTNSGIDIETLLAKIS